MNASQPIRVELDRGEAEVGVVWLETSAGEAYQDAKVEDAEGDRLMVVANKLRAALSQDFGPREDEDGEGLKPADPSDGDAIGEAAPNTGTPTAHAGTPAGSTSPDTEVPEGAESSRVGGPSTGGAG